MNSTKNYRDRATQRLCGQGSCSFVEGLLVPDSGCTACVLLYMANIFTYLGTLEELKSKIQWEDKSSTEIEERLRLVGMLYYVADTINYFERAVKKAEESITKLVKDNGDIVDFQVEE